MYISAYECKNVHLFNFANCSVDINLQLSKQEIIKPAQIVQIIEIQCASGPFFETNV